MNEIGKLIVTLVTVFSLIGSIVFYLNMTDYMVRISQGDYNATRDMVEEVAEEITDTIIWSTIIGFLIAIAGALGLTGLVAFLKKL